MKYIFPFAYAFSTRNKTIFYKVSFFLVIVLPILIISLAGNNDNDIMLNMLKFIAGFTALYCIYEIGYIFNDTYTVRFETNPTIRLSKKENDFVERSANFLISIRVFYVFILLLLLNYLGVSNLALFAVMLGLLDVSYAIHNYFRNRVNIISIFFVVVFKYISVPILFMPLDTFYYYAFILILLVPVLRTIEFAAKDKYKIKLFYTFNFDRFRIWYYLVLTIFFTVLSIIDYKFLIGLFLSFYFLVFRFAGYFILRTNKIGRKIKHVREQN
jgi:hypothetical protein